MKYYILDSTVNKEARFGSYKELVTYLEQLCQRKFRQTRKQRMIMLEEIGHGYDDTDSVVFVRSMAEVFDIGILREGNRVRCDVTSASLFNKEEYGN